MVLSLSISEDGACEVLGTACGTYEGAVDAGATLVVGVSGLDGTFRTVTKSCEQTWLCWLERKEKLKMDQMDLLATQLTLTLF